MRRLDRSAHRAATVAAAVAAGTALAVACRSLPPAPPRPAPPVAFAIESFVPPPVIRVGLATDASRVSVSADAGVVLWARPGAAAPVCRVELAVATFRRSGAALGATRFRVQVASLGDEAAARDAAARAQAASGLPTATAWNPLTKTWQVRVGELATRADAAALVGRLGARGFPGAFLAEEASPDAGVRILETGEEFAAVTIAPAGPGEPVSVDSMPYRGVIEVRPGGEGALVVINALNMEDYLRGVVPNELSPQSFPALEALKAQAVAARTYALRNKGQFQARGYDICATPACQVYRGKSSENPLSDRAVLETQGLAAAYSGQPINALYTSTCGGHTEDGANMFEGEDTPYLRGVVCAPERTLSAGARTTAPTKPLGEEEGLNRDAALLVSLGVLEAKAYAAAALKGNATEAELLTWTQRLSSALRRSDCDVPTADGSVTRRGRFFVHLVGALCWQERERRLLSPEDPNYLLQVEDRAALDNPGESLPAALLLQEGILSPFADNTLRPAEPMTRMQAVRMLARAAERAGAPGILAVDFQGLDDDGVLKVKRGETAEARRLDPGVRLFRALDGTRLAASELTLTPGERLRIVEQDGRVTFLEVEQSRLGASSDRGSRYFRWEVRLTPAEVAKAVARYGSVGQVRDVVARRTGVSGRVVELSVLGDAGELLLRGLKIRWALGLRENLFVIERERDERGHVARFVFTGKGWGHGVGLCQVGAYGMAQSGASFDRILRHYYSGVTIEKLY